MHLSLLGVGVNGTSASEASEREASEREKRKASEREERAREVSAEKCCVIETSAALRSKRKERRGASADEKRVLPPQKGLPFTRPHLITFFALPSLAQVPSQPSLRKPGSQADAWLRCTQGSVGSVLRIVAGTNAPAAKN